MVRGALEERERRCGIRPEQHALSADHPSVPGNTKDLGRVVAVCHKGREVREEEERAGVSLLEVRGDRLDIVEDSLGVPKDVLPILDVVGAGHQLDDNVSC